MNKVKSFVSDVLTNGSSTTGLRQIANRGSSRFRASLKCCNVRCVVTILLGIAALLPAIFLLPPLPTSPKLLQSGHPIVATFQLPISATIIKEHTHQLEKNLEIAFGFAGTKQIVAKDEVDLATDAAAGLLKLNDLVVVAMLHDPRCTNEVAHMLVRFAIGMDQPTKNHLDMPPCVTAAYLQLQQIKVDLEGKTFNGAASI